jgi:enoyl-CoA hydratase/carnithine racemase
MSDSDPIQYEVTGQVARIWLNRPEKRNAFTLAMIDEMRRLFASAQKDPQVRVILLRGRGGTLCAGMDLDEVMASGTVTRADHEPYLALCNAIGGSRKPTVAVVEGYLTGGGHSLTLNCDFVIAAEDAKLGDFYQRRGLVGAGNAYYWLPRMVGMRRAKKLILTGALLTGAEAADWGLVTEAVPAADLDRAVERLVGQLVDKSPLAMEIGKITLERSFDLDWASFQTMQELASDHVVSTSYDAQEGITAFLEKRKPEFEGR